MLLSGPNAQQHINLTVTAHDTTSNCAMPCSLHDKVKHPPQVFSAPLSHGPVNYGGLGQKRAAGTSADAQGGDSFTAPLSEEVQGQINLPG